MSYRTQLPWLVVAWDCGHTIFIPRTRSAWQWTVLRPRGTFLAALSPDRQQLSGARAGIQHDGHWRTVRDKPEPDPGRALGLPHAARLQRPALRPVRQQQDPAQPVLGCVRSRAQASPFTAVLSASCASLPCQDLPHPLQSADTLTRRHGRVCRQLGPCGVPWRRAHPRQCAATAS